MSNDTDKSATMKQYFACMDSADFVTSAAMFADDAVYLRPPYVAGQAAFASSGTERIEGLPAISKFWEQRGKRGTHHVIKIESTSGSEWFAEGEVSVDDSETRMFLTHVTFSDKGQIERFVALR
jgi:hypothetical protein